MSDARCPAISSTGERCWLVEHDHATAVHVTVSGGWLQPWLGYSATWTNRDLADLDPLRDAPTAWGGPVRPQH